jgi:hypothetical protein
MDANRFDAVAKLFASRRASRTQATAPAQDATPAAGGTATKTQFLFLQSFRKGNLEPKPGVDGTWTLTLEQGVGQTIYFSNRPERVVGAAPTPQFLDGLGFPDDNPPNAALVFHDAAGNEDVTVVELFNPTYELDTNTATYDVQWLKEYQRLDLTLQETPEEPADAAVSFGPAHLFIDDCPESRMFCVPKQCPAWSTKRGQPGCEVFGIIESNEHDGWCYSWSAWACLPCQPWSFNYRSEAFAYWSVQCNRRFAACDGNCHLYDG